jgi:GrpB-like predicted nucleotidyltransferase (UPF0157 family)
MHPPITRSGTEWSNASEDRVEIVAPDPSWPRQYEEEAAALRSRLKPFGDFRLEHFGSTAIPNLRSKPIIDILLVHPTPTLWPQLIGPIQSLGYAYWSENPRKDQMFFVKGMPPLGPGRTHHVHVRLPHDVEKELAFRDLLRANPTLAQRYGILKDTLAGLFPTDRAAYTDGKTVFVSEVLGPVPSNSSSSGRATSVRRSTSR